MFDGVLDSLNIINIIIFKTQYVIVCMTFFAGGVVLLLMVKARVADPVPASCKPNVRFIYT